MVPPPPSAGLRSLLSALVAPRDAAPLPPADWDLLVRLARRAQLLGTLAARLDDAGVLDGLAPPVRDALTGALLEARFVGQMARVETDALAQALAPLATPLVLLKGASYIVQGLPLARGRLLRDVDLLVPPERLADAERALAAAGWAADEALDAYDQRYYRAWSHQLPPLRRPGGALEADLHHAILPPTGRLHPDAARLVRDARAVGGPWRVADPADQVVHASVHLFQDSDCTSKLREVVDVDALCRHHAAADAAFWPRLAARAALHGTQRPVAYALAFAQAWLRTPVPEAFTRACGDDPRWRPHPWVLRHAALALPPPDPDGGRDRASRRAARALFLRAQWLRMPVGLLVRHAAAKAWRALR